MHDRKDLSPNVCAVYIEESFRGKGIAGKLLNLVVSDMKAKGISPLFLVTDHTGFYERYVWEFFCMAQGDDEPERTRLYIHRCRNVTERPLGTKGALLYLPFRQVMCVLF